MPRCSRNIRCEMQSTGRDIFLNHVLKPGLKYGNNSVFERFNFTRVDI